MELLEHLLEDRDQEGDQREQDDEREARDQHRVEHRRLHLTAQRVVLLELVGDAIQRLLQDPPHLTGGDHGDVKVVEDLGVALEGVREGDTGLDVLAHRHERLAHLVALGLLLEHVQRAQQRHARRDHRRELARGDRELVGLDALEAPEHVADVGALELLDVEDDQALRPQL